MDTEIITRYEPKFDKKTGLYKIGDSLKNIPEDNTLNHHLIGFYHSPSLKEKEYYFWRICDMLWNHDGVAEPLMVRHPWAEEIIQAALKNKYVAIGGAASSGKSHTMAAWGIVNWLARPDETFDPVNLDYFTGGQEKNMGVSN